MDFVTSVTTWLEQNWGVTVFGGLTIGGLITTAIVLFKQWMANKVQGTKYEGMFNSAVDGITAVKNLYQAEKAKNNELTVQNIFMQQSQAVLMDAIIKMALSSKLDSDDKTSIVANVERLKLMTPQQIVETVKTETTDAVIGITQELNENPAQTVYNITEGVSTLLDKYTTTTKG